MITILILALWRGFGRATTAFVHACSHGLSWLLLPQVARTGYCIDCNPAQRRAAWLQDAEAQRQRQYDASHGASRG